MMEFYFLCDTPGKIGVSLNHINFIRESQDEGSALIAHLGDMLLDWDLERVLDAIARLDLLVVSTSEDSVLLIAVVADVVCHILNESDRWYLEAVEHFNSLNNIDVAQPLWSRHNHCSCKVQFLTESKLDISCSWRKVDYEVVELSPVRLTDELSDQIRHHRASHHCSLTLGRKAIAHALDV